MEFDFTQHPHRRFNPLTREWVLVSPHRTKRPWQGAVGEDRADAIPQYEPSCYLCPGNERAGGHKNPPYEETFVYDNDFPALLPDSPSGDFNQHDLLISQPEKGLCKVICFTPRHDMSLARMPLDDIYKVIEIWRQQYEELGALDFINHVQIFENREGNSSPHPHCQIWATERIPQDPEIETESQALWLKEKGSDLLGDYLEIEIQDRSRIIAENESFVALAPFWAVWPYEVMAISRRKVANLSEMTREEKMGMADILRRITTAYDNLFRASFPYSMGIHQAPTDGKAHPEWRLHLHFTSSVLRSPTIPKFMVGYERLGEPQRDFTPEYAAKALRELPTVHYMEGRQA